MAKNLNDGQSHELDEIEELGLEKSAKEFSEGDQNLEQILLRLWKLKIETVACCIGRYEENHQIDDDKLFKIPYLTIKITDENLEQVMMLIKHIMSSKDPNKPNIRFDRYDYDLINNSHHSSMLTLERVFISKQNAKNMFKCILDCINDLKNNKTFSSEINHVSLEMIEKLSQCQITNPFIHKCEVVVNHKNQSTFSFGPLKVNNIKDKQTFKCKLNSDTLKNIEKKCSFFMKKTKNKKDTSSPEDELTL